jgi:hypothetical protein
MAMYTARIGIGHSAIEMCVNRYWQVTGVSLRPHAAFLNIVPSSATIVLLPLRCCINTRINNHPKLTPIHGHGHRTQVRIHHSIVTTLCWLQCEKFIGRTQTLVRVLLFNDDRKSDDDRKTR